jgi:hypothetical protein
MDLTANSLLPTVAAAEKRPREEEEEDSEATETDVSDSEEEEEEEEQVIPSTPTQHAQRELIASSLKPPAAKRHKVSVEEIATIFENTAEYKAFRCFLCERDVFAPFSPPQRMDLPYLYAMKSYTNYMVTGLTALIETEKKRQINPDTEAKCRRVGRAVVTSLKKISASHASLLKTMRS